MPRCRSRPQPRRRSASCPVSPNPPITPAANLQLRPGFSQRTGSFRQHRAHRPLSISVSCVSFTATSLSRAPAPPHPAAHAPGAPRCRPSACRLTPKRRYTFHDVARCSARAEGRDLTEIRVLEDVLDAARLEGRGVQEKQTTFPERLPIWRIMKTHREVVAVNSSGK